MQKKNRKRNNHSHVLGVTVEFYPAALRLQKRTQLLPDGKAGNLSGGDVLGVSYISKDQ